MKPKLSVSCKKHTVDVGNSITAPTAENHAPQNSGHQPRDSIIFTGQTRYQFSTDIPCYYNKTYLSVLARNPDQVFVFWEIPAFFRKKLKRDRDLSGIQLILRLTEVLSDADEALPEYYDIELDPACSTLHVSTPHANVCYALSLGVTTARNTFRLICHAAPTTGVPQPDLHEHARTKEIQPSDVRNEHPLPYQDDCVAVNILSGKEPHVRRAVPAEDRIRLATISSWSTSPGKQ